MLNNLIFLKALKMSNIVYPLHYWQSLKNDPIITLKSLNSKSRFNKTNSYACCFHSSFDFSIMQKFWQKKQTQNKFLKSSRWFLNGITKTKTMFYFWNCEWLFMIVFHEEHEPCKRRKFKKRTYNSCNTNRKQPKR